MAVSQRQLGRSELRVSPVALGCWPLAGITSGAMADEAAVAVIDAALEAGVNHLDTAYAYGRSGESDRRIARAIRNRRDGVVLATKVGVYWDQDGALQRTGRPDPTCSGNILPWCRTHQVSVVAYEPLALGLLTGKFTRDHVFPDDWRRRSPLVAGDAWTRSLEEVERLRPLAAARGCSLA